MHTLVEVTTGANGTTHVPAFLAKLWKIVDDPATNDLICWSEVGVGNSFIIRNQAKFARDLLPLYYKHNNMASFVRQLNMYGFHKVVSVEQGGLRVEKDEMEFAHPFFLRGQEASLELIKRKIPATKHEDTRSRPDSLNKVLLDVRQMKGRQESMDTKLGNMKRENEALWRELSSLRQKHAKQTQIVSKLLQFLVGMMSSQTHRLGFKRRMPLMLNDTAGAKPAKINRTKNAGELTGPVIHDVTELFDCEVDDTDEVSAEYANEDAKVESPMSSSAKSPYPDSIYGLGAVDETADMLLSVDPMSINPSINVTKKAATNSAKAPRIQKREPAEVDNVQTQQFVQQNATNVLLATPSTVNQTLPTYFLAGVDDNGQVILTIPDDQSAAGLNTNLLTNATPQGPQNTVSETTPRNEETSKEMVPVNMESTKRRNPVVSTNNFLKPKYELKEDFDDHLDSMQHGLDNLRDLLQADQYSIDSSTLLGVGSNNPFNMHNSIDPLTVAKLFGDDNHEILGLQEQQLMNQQPALNENQNQVQSSELVSYNPSLFELTEDDTNFFDEATNMYLDDELNSMMTTERDKLNNGNGYSPLTFTEVTMGNPPASLNTPVTETLPLFGSSSVASTSGAGKRKRK